RLRRKNRKTRRSVPADLVFQLGDFEPELGATLSASRLGCRTHGTLAPGRDNAILFPHMYSATPASLDPWIAPGRALDPSRWFVVCPAQLAGTIAADVEAQHRLVTEQLGVERLAVVAGLARTTAANDLLVAASAEALEAGGTEQHARFWAATALSPELF